MNDSHFVEATQRYQAVIKSLNDELAACKNEVQRLSLALDREILLHQGTAAERDAVNRELELSVASANGLRTTSERLRAELERVKRQNHFAIAALDKCSRAWKWLEQNPGAPIAATAHMESAIALADTIVAGNGTTAGSELLSSEQAKPTTPQ